MKMLLYRRYPSYGTGQKNRELISKSGSWVHRNKSWGLVRSRQDRIFVLVERPEVESYSFCYEVSHVRINDWIINQSEVVVGTLYSFRPS